MFANLKIVLFCAIINCNLSFHLFMSGFKTTIKKQNHFYLLLLNKINLLLNAILFNCLTLREMAVLPIFWLTLLAFLPWEGWEAPNIACRKSFICNNLLQLWYRVRCWRLVSCLQLLPVWLRPQRDRYPCVFVCKITRWSGAIKILLLFLSLEGTFSKQLLLSNKSFECVVWNIALKIRTKNV